MSSRTITSRKRFEPTTSGTVEASILARHARSFRKPVKVKGSFKPCHWCKKPSIGFYCVKHTKIRNKNDRQRYLLKKRLSIG